LKKLKLHGFNNLTKSLSFCIYDICYAKTAEERDGYIAYIDELYNANRLTEILSETCSIIGANILNIARQDYEPQGASVTILVSEEPVDPQLIDQTEHPGPLPEAVVAHLDKSHICVHTYPESHPGRRAVHLPRRYRSLHLRGYFTAESAELSDPPAGIGHCHH
jgi:S-adenosylmethionine decarboxylase